MEISNFRNCNKRNEMSNDPQRGIWPPSQSLVKACRKVLRWGIYLSLVLYYEINDSKFVTAKLYNFTIECAMSSCIPLLKSPVSVFNQIN